MEQIDLGLYKGWLDKEMARKGDIIIKDEDE